MACLNDMVTGGTHQNLLLIWVIAAALSFCSAFLLSDNCPVSPPCTCSGSSSSYSYVYCNSKSLKAVPNIKQANIHVNKLYLCFQFNGLTVINDDVFRNVSTINASIIVLRLYSNKIHTIATNAFNGIENTTSYLYLNNNYLTSLPEAIGKLVNLKYLDISNNPLHSLDQVVMSKIGRSLTYLDLDLNLFTEWPPSFHYLRVLQILIANNIVPFTHLDVNAFHGFENTLTSLTLDYSELKKVPYAICHLSRLTSLTFSHDRNLKENTSFIFEPCAGKLLNISYLALNGNDLHEFPDVFTLFPSLTQLYLPYNKLESIESFMIPASTKLMHIYLDNNLFERIPPALNKLKSLRTLYIQNNNIKRIEAADLAGLSFLNDLKLYKNPVAYISPSAFKHNLKLTTLDLRYTNLDHIPIAVTHLPLLRNLYFSGRPIKCTCDMSYLKHWNVSAVTTFTTRCDSSTETIKTFVMNSLQACP